MNTLEKLEILSNNCGDRTELDRILNQLLNVVLARHRQKLAGYDLDISKFEQIYNLDSMQFQEQFEGGMLGMRWICLNGLVCVSCGRIF